MNLNFKTLLAATFLASSPCVFGSEIVPNNSSQTPVIEESNQQPIIFKKETENSRQLLSMLLCKIKEIEKEKTGNLEQVISDLHSLLDSTKFSRMDLFMGSTDANRSDTGFMELTEHYRDNPNVMSHAFYHAVIRGKRDLAKRVLVLDTNNHIKKSSNAALSMITHTGEIGALDLILLQKQSPYEVAKAMISASLRSSELKDRESFINRISELNPDIVHLKKANLSSESFVPECKALIEACIEFDMFKSNPNQFCGYQPQDVMTVRAFDAAVERGVFKSRKYITQAREFVARNILSIDATTPLTREIIEDAFSTKDTSTKERLKKYTDAKNALISTL